MNPSGAKLQGGAGLHGADYQIVLYMLFLLKGYARKKNFRLSAENQQAGKFDDLVFQDDHETILLQAKHKTNISRRISPDQLLSATGEYSLRKYFDSFSAIYSKFPHASYVICTNIDVNSEVSDKFTEKIEMEKGSIFFNCCKTEVKQYFYSFDTDKMFKTFQEQNSNIDEEVFRKFLNNCQLVILTDDNIEQITMKILEKMLVFDKRLKIKVVYNFFCNKLKKWFGETKLRYLTNLHLESYFSEMLSTLFLERLEDHEHEITFSNSPITSNKQITIIKTTRYLLVMLKLFKQFSDDEKKNMLFVDPQLGSYQETMISAFQLQHFTKLICPVVGQFKQTLISAIENLLQTIQTKKYKQIFILAESDLPPNCLENAHTTSDEDILENVKLNNANKKPPTEVQEVYIKRYLIFANDKFGSNTEEEFLNKVLSDNRKIFLLSDVAGMGKTTTLSYLINVLKKNYKDLWVKKVNISSYTLLFHKSLKNKNPLDLDELLNFQGKMEEFEKQIISLPDMLILMLDGLDEVPYDHIKLILRFIEDSTTRLNIKKIFITARPQIEDFISKNLEVEIFSLKPLVKTEQYHMIFEYWIRNLDVTDEEKKNKCLEYGEKLLNSLSPLLLNLNKLIGIPLVVKMLSEIFEPEAKKYCLVFEEDETNKLFDHFNLAMLYDKFIERKKDIYIAEKNNAGKAAYIIFDSYLTECTFLALTLIFPEEIHTFFEISPPSGASDSNSLCDTGIVTFSNGVYEFLHRTFAEHLVAQYLYNEVENAQETRVKFLIQTIFICDKYSQDRRYNGVYRFFNSILENEKNNIEPKVYKIWGKAIEEIYSMNGDFILIPWDFGHILHLLLDECIVAKQILTNYEYLTNEPLLHTAAKSGYTDIVKYLMETGVDVDIKNREGETALHVVVGLARAPEPEDVLKTNDIVKYLIEQGANVNNKDVHGISVLHKAASSNNWWAINYLLEKGADVHIVDNSGRSILHHPFIIKPHYNMNTGILSSTEYLLQKGANINAQQNDGTSVLHSYVKADLDFSPLEYIKFLVSKGADINATDNDNNSILHTSASKNRSYMRDLVDGEAKYLIENDPNVNRTDKDGTSISYYTEENCDNREILNYLIENGADVNAINNSKESVLHSALSSSNIDIVYTLVEKGANVNAVDNKSRSILHVAVLCRGKEETKEEKKKKKRKPHLVQYLVEKGAIVNAVDKDEESVLQYATKFGSSEIVNYLIKKGANVNSVNINKESVLHSAVLSGDSDIVHTMVEKGANVNAVNSKLKSILHVAVSCCKKKKKPYLVQYLVEKGANVNAVDKNEESVLYNATKFGNREVVNYLLKKGANVNTVNKNKESVLHLAVLSGDVDIVHSLVEKGANINAVDNKLRSILHIAVSVWKKKKKKKKKKKTNIVQYLVGNGANVNAVDIEKKSVLYYAAKFGNRDIVNYLIGKSADVNAVNNTKESVLHAAVSSGDVDIVRSLVEKGANVNAVDNKLRSILHIAASCWKKKKKKKQHLVQYLVENGANINAIDQEKESVLFCAAKIGNRGIVYYLIEKAADLNTLNNSKESVLHAAVLSGDVDIVQSLVEKGANINAADNNLRSILHVAVADWKKTKNTYLIQYLVENGANVNAVDKDDESVLYYAAKYCNSEIVNILIENGARVNDVNTSDESVLHAAVSAGDFEVVYNLIENGANINAVDNKLRSILHVTLACWKKGKKKKKPYLIQYLIEKGANVNAVDSDEESVLSYAKQFGNKAIANYLIENGAK